MGGEFVLGVNYWARGLGTSMWRRWRREVIESDVKLMKELGINSVRFFILIQDFSNPHAEVREEACAHLREFLKLLKENGIKAYLTLLVGHMSGRNWLIPFEGREGIFSTEFLYNLRKFLNSLIKCVGRDVIKECVSGWVISNELMLYSRPKSRAQYLGFVRAVKDLIKSLDPNKPVGLGDVSDLGTEPPNMAEVADYNAFHLYYYDSDVVRHGLAYAFATELYSLGGKVRVVAEELGFSSAQYSDEEITKFLRVVLTTVLANGASGALIWCFSDFSTEAEPPYLWKPFELSFGLVRSDGSLKPQAYVVREFSKLISELSSRGFLSKFRPIKDSVVITYPAFTYRDDIEFISYDYSVIMSALLESYVALKTAGVNPLVLPEEYLSRYGSVKVVLAPSIPTMLSTTWRWFISYVESGGVLYYSFAKYPTWLHEAPTHLWSELFGVVPNLPAGSVGTEAPTEVFINYGKYREVIKVPRRGFKAISYLFKPIKSEVVGRDSSGTPQVFINRLGNGYAVLTSFPIEALSYDRYSRDSWRVEVRKLYSLVMKLANVRSYVSIEGGEDSIEVVPWGGSDEALLFIINHSVSNTEFKVLLSKGVRRYEVIHSLGNVTHEPSNDSLRVRTEGRSASVIYIEHP